MQYMGGKSRISRQIAEVINEISRRQIKNFKTDSRSYIGSIGKCAGGKTAPSLAYFAVAVQ